MLSYKNTFIFSLITLISTVCLAQEFIYEKLGVDEGLPSSQVYDAYQSKEGYIWFATDKGVSKYNGYEFENFDTNDGLTGNVVLRFYPQKNGQIWCYSYHNKSLFYFDELFKGFTPYKYNNILAQNLFFDSVIKSVYIDAANNLHIGGHYINGELIIDPEGKIKNNYASEDYFITKFSSKKRIVLDKSPHFAATSFFFTTNDTSNIQKRISAKYIHARIMADWLTPQKTGVFINDSLVSIVNKNKIFIKDKYSPIALKVIDNEHFFVGYEFGGGKIINKKGRILKSFLKGKSVTDLLIDHEGGFWFTTLNSGIYYVKNPSVNIYNIADQTNIHVNNLAKTKNKELLVGYNNGDILKLLKNRNSITLDASRGFRRALVEHDSVSNETYLYNAKGFVNISSQKTLLKGHILKLSEPIDSTIFVSRHKCFHVIKNNKLIAINNKLPFRVHDVTLWNKDTILGTPLGIFKFNNGEITPLSKKSELFNFRSDDVDVSKNKKTLYIATQNAGLVISDGNHTYNITEKNGLYSNIINEISIENDSTIWLCTNKGLNRIIFSKNHYQVNGIDKKRGLLSNEIEDIEIINDTVWAGTKQGLCFFSKNQLTPQKINNTYFKLKKAYTNNNPKDSIKDNATLSYKENEIDFIVEGISFANKGDLHYQYRLNNQEFWTATKDRKIHFSSLPPNHYTFEIKMCFNNKNCSEKTVTFSFTILPPLWKTGWFKMICALGIFFLVYVFFRIRVLTYNKDIVRELLRVFLKYLKRKEDIYFSFKENGNEVRIKSQDILYIKSSGNYIDVFTKSKTHTVRMNIGKFLSHIPDKLEYIRIHRSYIVRIDKITSKSKDKLKIDDLQLPVSQSYLKNLQNIHF